MEGMKRKRVGYWAWPWDTSQMGAWQVYFESQYTGLPLPTPDLLYYNTPEQHAFVDKLNRIETGLCMAYEAAQRAYRAQMDEFADLPVNTRRSVGAPQFDYDSQSVVEYKGYSACRVCGLRNGSMEYRLTMGDTTFVWPEGYIHYIRDHGVRPDPDFEAAVTAHYEKARLVE